MSDSPDYAALARQYLDLWEEHLTAIANDPALATQVSAMFGLMGQMMPPVMPGAAPDGAANPLAAMQQMMAQMMAAAASTAAPAAATEKGKRDDQSPPDTNQPGAGQPGTRSPAGATPAGAAPDDGDERLDELAQRLAAVEEQLAAMAAGSRDGGPKPAGRARRRKPAAKRRKAD